MTDGIQVPSEFVKERRKARQRFWQGWTVCVCAGVGALCVLFNLICRTVDRYPETSVWFECAGLVLLIAVCVIWIVKLLLSLPNR